MKPSTSPKHPLRFALWGTGFWSRFQLSAWKEIPGAQCVALYNRTRSKAQALGKEFGIEAIYDDPRRLLDKESIDFVDIVTDVSTHAELTTLAASYGKPVICQKPIAQCLSEAKRMVETCRSLEVPLFIHENWRWQAPIRELHRLLNDGVIGEVFRGQIDMISGFPVFENQPFLRDSEQFIIADLGSHILDTARFLFGEARDLSCWAGRSHKDIRGEDHATIVMQMGAGRVQVLAKMAYAENFVERECFPQTLFFVEGSKGSIEIAPGYELRITTEAGTSIRKCRPQLFGWEDPQYEVVHASITPCQKDLLDGLQGAGRAETTGEDNLRTAQLVDAAYRSCDTQQRIQF